MSMNARLEPALYLFAGLFGVAGVALAALAAHGGGEANLAASASAMCLAHAPALLALALGNARFRTAWLAGFLMIVGTLLFAGDLVTLRFTGSSLFPYAAPTGGWAMMLGWLAVAAGAVFRVRT
ncbi:DUF423 domain-containing protein [Rhizobium ruizarguesonis]|jgi:uncharacterized membrane protein YgdD (TMEM256/DUF423 family)|uniref:DUF423 domain-containing protein n=1 Tax=Rhizobium ruizarguesonis TaxID=2081791 RepID=A0AB38I6Q3_9HYPH|nr:DUF423 domain-containing protein [Rhizobium ruizarguesonis]MBY5855289.1 DUF423 domain-containing protein [Rhizobium leguminosarum]NKK56903.1 DUF423 domain-containing protein [Rhizobium leguminosarum bv. viciae]MBY5885509.1 DUF423 domain-containing protein [Rhizobium leguminosarum]NEI08546.1 DUF423 domain-containing protein [Rhizobium ruizarguesonis]NEI30719.1 DUF423 domain-containing protein [Rhizobium ruizarguesonis]